MYSVLLYYKQLKSWSNLITRSIVISGVAKMLATIDQMSDGLASYGALDFIRSNKVVMKAVFTADGANHFKPTAESFLDSLTVQYSADGSNAKASEIDVFNNFSDYVQDLGTTDGTVQCMKIWDTS